MVYALLMHFAKWPASKTALAHISTSPVWECLFSKVWFLKKCSLLPYRVLLGSLSVLPVQVIPDKKDWPGHTSVSGGSVLAGTWEACQESLIWNSLLAQELPFVDQTRSRKKEVSMFAYSEAHKSAVWQTQGLLTMFSPETEPFSDQRPQIWWLQGHDINQAPGIVSPRTTQGLGMETALSPAWPGPLSVTREQSMNSGPKCIITKPIGLNAHSHYGQCNYHNDQNQSHRNCFEHV